MPPELVSGAASLQAKTKANKSRQPHPRIFASPSCPMILPGSWVAMLPEPAMLWWNQSLGEDLFQETGWGNPPLGGRAMNLDSGSPSVAPGFAASPGNLLETHIFRPCPSLLNQKLWGRPSFVCFNNQEYSYISTSCRTSEQGERLRTEPWPECGGQRLTTLGPKASRVDSMRALGLFLFRRKS